MKHLLILILIPLALSSCSDGFIPSKRTEDHRTNDSIEYDQGMTIILEDTTMTDETDILDFYY